MRDARGSSLAPAEALGRSRAYKRGLMKLVRTFGGILALGALSAIAVLYGRPVAGFDIQDSPTLVSRPGADISDVYLFPSPTNSNDVVAVMNVHPGLPAGTAATAFFDSQVLYTMKFDTRYSAEAIGSRPSENLVIQFSMGVVSGGTQQIFVYGPTAPNQTGTTTTLVSGGLTTGTGLINQTFPAGNLTVFAGVREDPFFFDLTQFYNIIPDRNKGSTTASCLPGVGSGSCPTGFNATGTDFFANSNVLSIVVEMPKAVLSQSQGASGSVVGYWATTSTQSGT